MLAEKKNIATIKNVQKRQNVYYKYADLITQKNCHIRKTRAVINLITVNIEQQN